MVAHDRVHDLERLGPVFHRLLHQQRLARLGKITGIDAVEPHAQPPVVRQRRRAVAGARKPGRGAQPARVGGKHGCGEGHGLQAQRRKDGNDHREPRPAKPGQVVDAKDSFGGNRHNATLISQKFQPAAHGTDVPRFGLLF